MTSLNNLKNVVVNRVEAYQEDVSLTVLNNSANHELDCIDGISIYFDITATSKNKETRSFTIVYQNEDRTNRIKAYNGYEVENSTCDADQSSDLQIFLDYDDSAEEALYLEATRLSKEALAQLLR